MSIYDRDFSKIKAAAVVEGSKVQCQNVLQAALDEIAILRAENAQQAKEIARLREVVGYVETWICNPASSYSVYALDGLFSVTRDKINDAPARR